MAAELHKASRDFHTAMACRVHINLFNRTLTSFIGAMNLGSWGRPTCGRERRGRP